VVFTLALAGFVGSVRSQDDSSIGLLPGGQRASKVLPTARNPFAKKEEPKLEISVEPDDLASEENQIRAVLEGLRVVGRTRGEQGWKVLLGDMILEDGTKLPRVLDGQTQDLRVRKIHEKTMEIEWAESDPNEPPRLIVIQIGLEPKVRSALSGASATEGGPVPAVVSAQPRRSGE
jgi:hypothetical protein